MASAQPLAPAIRANKGLVRTPASPLFSQATDTGSLAVS